VLESAIKRRRRRKGKSGKYLVTTGMSVLVVGMFTESLDTRVVFDLSVLEIGILVLGIALGRLALVVVARKLKRTVLKGVGIAGLSVALPAIPFAAPVVATVGGLLPSLVAVPFASKVITKLPTGVASVFGLGPTRFQRLKRALGGVRGVSAGSVGTVLVGYGVETGQLNEVYDVFGHQLSLLAVFSLLSVPGAIIYAVRNY